MELALVKSELKEVKSIYANMDALKKFPEKFALLEKYRNAVSMASSELIAFFVYRYMESYSLKIVADRMQLSEVRVLQVSRELNNFFCKNL